jgi:hypothetical protein
MENLETINEEIINIESVIKRLYRASLKGRVNTIGYYPIHRMYYNNGFLYLMSDEEKENIPINGDLPVNAVVGLIPITLFSPKDGSKIVDIISPLMEKLQNNGEENMISAIIHNMFELADTHSNEIRSLSFSLVKPLIGQYEVELYQDVENMFMDAQRGLTNVECVSIVALGFMQFWGQLHPQIREGIQSLLGNLLTSGKEIKGKEEK